jgi:glucokinase
MLLAGDIGGTKTDLAVFGDDQGARHPIARRIITSGDYSSLEAIAQAYLAEVDLPVTRACFAVAGPVQAGRATLTNLPWRIEEEVLRTTLGLEVVTLLNDVEAMAVAIPHLIPSELRIAQDGNAIPGGTIAIVAPGTGLGQAFLTWDGIRYHVHPSEGGHADFAPTTTRELALLQYLRARWGRVSYERVCAGRSIPDLYEFVRDEHTIDEAPQLRDELANASERTPIIVAAAGRQPDPDPLCLATVDLFAMILGGYAGDLALTVLATGGIYLAGGIVQHLIPATEAQVQMFLSSFRTKGRLSALLEHVPIRIVIEPIALFGAALHGLNAD